MRILYLLTDGFGERGGIAQFNRDCLKAICSYPGLTEVVALPRNARGPIGQLSEKLRYDLGAAGGKLRYLLRTLRWSLSAADFKLVLCTHLHLLPLALLAAWRTGAPVVVVLHGVEAWSPPGKILRRLAARHADWVVAVSSFTLKRFAEWVSLRQDRTVVFPCCVDFARFAPGEAPEAITDKYRIVGRTVVLTLGRLVATERYKGFDELLEVLGRLRQAEPNVVCVIAGSGDDQVRLEAKARALGIADHVRFTGYVPDEDLVGLYRAAHVFVLAGYGEGFGIVLLEAMACGIPVVASTLDGSFEAVGRGTLGIAVNPRDPDALAKAILDGLARPVGMRPEGLEGFSFPAFQDRAHALLQRLLKNQSAENVDGTMMGHQRSVEDRASS
jgi:glycosyltransferase involved in cell wall biosynthesis